MADKKINFNDPKWDKTLDFSTSNWCEQFDTFLDEAMAQSDALGDGVKVGKIFSVSVADGSAYYMVTKVNKLTARVKWIRALSIDEYQDWNLGKSGSLQIAKLAPMLAYDTRLRQMMRDRKRQ